MYSLTVVQLESVEALWPELKPLFAPAVEYCAGELDVDDVLSLVKSKQAFIAVMSCEEKINLALAFQVLVYPKKTVLHVLAMGGEKFDVCATACWGEIENLAKVLGACAVRASVRPSMERYAKRVVPEAQKIYTVVERPIGA